MLEFHIHGSNATKKKLLEVLNKFPNFREAEPVSTNYRLIFILQGEFTRRALENGKLDLLKVEGLNDLLNAESQD